MLTRPTDRIHIQEVGMRDGLQSAGQFVETEDKVRLLNRLSKTGLSKIEVTSFVSPKAVPLLADAETVLSAIDRESEVVYTALIPNLRGLDRALAVELDEVNVVMSVSEAHNMANLRMTCEDSLKQFREICVNRGSLRVNGSRNGIWLPIYWDLWDPRWLWIGRSDSSTQASILCPSQIRLGPRHRTRSSIFAATLLIHVPAWK